MWRRLLERRSASDFVSWRYATVGTCRLRASRDRQLLRTKIRLGARELEGEAPKVLMRGVRVKKMPHFWLADDVTGDSLLQLTIGLCLPLVLT